MKPKQAIPPVKYMAVILLALLIACSSAGKARIYYETLDLASPERAVATFVNAFNRSDFWTVWLVLATDAEFRWAQYTGILQYGALIQKDAFMEFKDEIPTFSQGLGSGEHSEADAGYFFDQLMLAASHHDAFLIDLRGKLHIKSSEQGTTSSGDPCVDVKASVGTLDDITFRTIQAPSGRWRVL